MAYPPRGGVISIPQFGRYGKHQTLTGENFLRRTEIRKPNGVQISFHCSRKRHRPDRKLHDKDIGVLNAHPLTLNIHSLQIVPVLGFHLLEA